MHQGFQFLSANYEADLVQRVQSPDHRISSEAFRKLENAFQPMLNGYARRIGGGALRKGEIEQELRLEFWSAVRRFDTTKGVRLGTFAAFRLNGCVSRLRKHSMAQNHVSLESLADREHAVDDYSAIASDHGSNAAAMREQIIVAWDVRPAVQAFVRRLPKAQREVADRILAGDETQAEVSRSLGISRQAVSKNMSRLAAAGRQQLAAFAA